MAQVVRIERGLASVNSSSTLIGERFTGTKSIDVLNGMSVTQVVANIGLSRQTVRALPPAIGGRGTAALAD